MSEQRELPLTFPELSPEAPLIPVRMVNEYVYCPRLAYLEWVQGEFAHSADTARSNTSGSILPEEICPSNRRTTNEFMRVPSC